MIGSQLLYEIILVKDIISPDTILNELNKSIIRVLQQDKNDSRDGMDMSVLALDSVNQKIELASAMNPIYIIRNGQELEEIKADKMPIGGANLLYKSRTFTKKTLDFDTKQPTTIYLCSDGYQDQFGGNHSKKFMSKNLKQFLMNISLQPMKLQGVALEDNITTWKGQEEQTDDILVIGIKV
jgi:serine phosphatase RsbU (regulator of sigma subunit)